MKIEEIPSISVLYRKLTLQKKLSQWNLFLEINFKLLDLLFAEIAVRQFQFDNPVVRVDLSPLLSGSFNVLAFLNLVCFISCWITAQ